MTTPIDPMAAVKLLRAAIEGMHVMFGPTETGKQALFLTASIEQPTREAVAWIDQFGNVFPLGAYSPTGKPSYLDADKRGWKPLYRAAQLAPKPEMQASHSAAAPNSAGAPVDERETLIREALNLALDLANAEAADVHEKYKGYLPHKHTEADADVETVKEAIAALQQLGKDKP